MRLSAIDGTKKFSFSSSREIALVLGYSTKRELSARSTCSLVRHADRFHEPARTSVPRRFEAVAHDGWDRWFSVASTISSRERTETAPRRLGCSANFDCWRSGENHEEREPIKVKFITRSSVLPFLLADDMRARSDASHKAFDFSLLLRR